MKKEILVFDADEKHRKNICDMLGNNEFRTAPMKSFSETEAYLEKKECRTLILNLDNTGLTNKAFRQLKRNRPHLRIIALSERRFHPELEEALRESISACLGLPVDTDELTYWLKTISENGENALD